MSDSNTSLPPPAVLTTSDPARLPADVVRLVGGAEIPPCVRFFEKRLTWPGLTMKLLMGLMMLAAGLAAIPLGIVVFFWLSVAGAVVAFAGAVVLLSIRERYRTMRSQARGDSTGYGLYLRADDLIIRSLLDITIIPRPCYLSLDGRVLSYEVAGKPKELRIPADFVNAEVDDVIAAIEAWAAAAG